MTLGADKAYDAEEFVQNLWHACVTPDVAQKARLSAIDGRTIRHKGYHYDSHDQLRTDLADFLAAYNFARRLKTLNGLTPYEYICKIWTSEPDRFILNPIHQMPGLNT